jgi:hypothetical protein
MGSFETCQKTIELKSKIWSGIISQKFEKSLEKFSKKN